MINEEICYHFLTITCFLKGNKIKSFFFKKKSYYDILEMDKIRGL